MKTLFIIPEYVPASGGIATFYSVLLPALAAHGHQVTAVVGSGLAEGPTAFNDQGVHILPIDSECSLALRQCFSSLALSPDLTRHLAAAWAVWQQTRGGEGFDVIECTDWGLLFVPWLLEPSSPPLVVRLHGSDGQIAHHDPESCSPLSGHLSQLIESALLPRAALLTTYSSANQKAWEEQLNRKVLYCPPPLAITPPVSNQQRSSGRGLVVGRVQRWKGPATLCRALEILGAEAPAVDWVGRSIITQATGIPFAAELRGEFPGIWGSRIVHHLPEPRDHIAKRQANAGFVLVPSDWDVFNFTAAEAMAMKAVVICSSGAGASDLIDHGKNGYLFHAGDAQGLATAIRQAQALTPGQRRVMGDAAHATVVDRLNPDEIARLIMDQFSQAMLTPRGHEPAQDLLRTALSPKDPSDSANKAIHRNLERLDLKLLLSHVRARIQRKALARFTR